MKLYCLSGLGVDHRAFRNLSIEGVELVHIPWVEHRKNETLGAYAKRLFHSVDLPKDYNLIGVSFGGMIAQEFAKIQQPKSLFLVSTITSSSELPKLFKVLGGMKLYRVIPRFILNRTNRITYFLFGTKEPEDKQLLNEILHDSNPSFLKWAMGAIVQWKNTIKPKAVNIHGSNDRILPQKGTFDLSVKNAGHFMIVTHAKQLSAFIAQELKSRSTNEH